MKNIIIMLILLMPVYLHAQKAKQKDLINKNIEVIGTYRYAENSMCSQNCTIIQLGGLSLKEPLKNVPQWSNDVVAYIKGKFIEVEELPTIAGPNPDTKNAHIKQKYIKVATEKQKVFDFVKITVNEKNKLLYNQKKNYDINLNITNPTEKEIEIYVDIDDLTIQKHKIAANSQISVNYTITNETDSYGYHNLHIYNYNKKEKDVREAAIKSGLLIDFEKSINTSDIFKN